MTMTLRVLILVLMEYTLRAKHLKAIMAKKEKVLILVLMEYTLREFETLMQCVLFGVLILVLMEYTLRDF